jgi:hypothetical protein
MKSLRLRRWSSWSRSACRREMCMALAAPSARKRCQSSFARTYRHMRVAVALNHRLLPSITLQQIAFAVSMRSLSVCGERSGGGSRNAKGCPENESHCKIVTLLEIRNKNFKKSTHSGFCFFGSFPSSSAKLAPPAPPPSPSSSSFSSSFSSSSPVLYPLLFNSINLPSLIVPVAFTNVVGN